MAGVLVVLLASGGGGFYLYQQSLPTVASLSPADGAQEVKLDAKLVLRFSRALDLRTLQAAFRISPTVEGSLATSPDHRTFTWSTDGPWQDLTGYTVSLSATHDAQGHQVPARHWRFTTTIVPRVTSISTSSGTQISDGAQIPLQSIVKFTFNDQMQQSTVHLLVNSAPLDLTWSPDGSQAAADLKAQKVGPLALALAAGGMYVKGRALLDWKLSASMVFTVQAHTVPLKAPALIQIPNDSGAFDQSGLQSADSVFEYLTEGGITRMTALYTNVPDIVGPVRSGRLISFQLDRHFHGLLFYSGLSEGSFSRLQADPVPVFSDTQGYFYRQSNRLAPDNLYINGDKIQAAVNAASDVGTFVMPPRGTVPITSGPAATSVSVAEHDTTYTFDAVTGTYLKTEGGHQLGDAALSQALHIQLVIVMHTTATTTSYVEDVNGIHGLDFDTISGGAVDYYFNGFKATGRWSGSDRGNPITFALDNGTAVPMPPGLTWIDVVS